MVSVVLIYIYVIYHFTQLKKDLHQRCQTFSQYLEIKGYIYKWKKQHSNHLARKILFNTHYFYSQYIKCN
jgi:hypothetical protein